MRDIRSLRFFRKKGRIPSLGEGKCGRFRVSFSFSLDVFGEYREKEGLQVTKDRLEQCLEATMGIL